jgi:heme A synthase
MKSIRHIVGVAIALVLIVTTTSAFIRLSQSGLSCRDRPACSGALVESLSAVLSEGSDVSIARAAHRVAAGAAGILFVVIAALGWERWRGDSRRAAAVALVVLASLLAWLGKYATSTMPAVMLGNLFGGMALLGLLAWLWRPDSGGEAPPVRLRLWIMIGLALATLQIAFGATMLITDFPIALAVLHNALASLALIVLVSVLGRLGSREKGP